MGIPSRDEPADDGSTERWPKLSEGPEQGEAQPQIAYDDSAPAKRADPLTAPLAELMADPLTGPLIHPQLVIPEPARGADEIDETDAAEDTEDTGDADEPDDSVEEPDVDPVEEPGEPSATVPERVRTEVTVGDVDTEGFEPSAPLDVFAALRQPAPTEPMPKKPRSRRADRQDRKRKQAQVPAPDEAQESEAPQPIASEPIAPEPPTTAIRRDVAGPETERITDAAVIGPALAAVMRVHDQDPAVEEPTAPVAEEPDEPTVEEPTEPAPPEEPDEPTAEEPEQPDEPEDEPGFETLEELLNAVTARTHPPTTLRPVDDQPLDDDPVEPAQATGPEPSAPRDDPRRTTAAEVARLLAPPPDPTPSEPTPPVPTAPSPQPAAPPVAQPAAQERPAPPRQSDRDVDTVDISARHSTQHLLLALLLVGLVVTAALAWLAWQERSTTSIAVAVAAAVVTFIVWNAHSTAAPPRVLVEHGQLDIRTHDSHHRFDLASSHTRIEVVGTAGRRSWKVLIHRTGMPPYKLDAATVDARAFTEVLERYRDGE